jgi:hypothetical protein
MPADQSFKRLLWLGKQQGGLTPHDLQQVLDVERLTTDELSDMLVRLDQAGVSVEIDPALLAPASGRAGLAPRPDNNLPDGCETPFKMPGEAPGQSSPEQSEAAPTVIQNQPGYLRDKAVSTAVAVALGIIVLLAILFAKAPYSRGHF